MEVVLDGSVASRLWRIPHVLHYRGNTLDQPRWAFDALTRFWAGTSYRVIAISEATAEIFRKRGLGARVTALHNPVDVEAYLRARRSDDVRQQLGAGPGDILLGTVGRIHPRKDLETFLRAAALLAETVTNAEGGNRGQRGGAGGARVPGRFSTPSSRNWGSTSGCASPGRGGTCRRSSSPSTCSSSPRGTRGSEGWSPRPSPQGCPLSSATRVPRRTSSVTRAAWQGQGTRRTSRKRAKAVLGAIRRSTAFDAGGGTARLLAALDRSARS